MVLGETNSAKVIDGVSNAVDPFITESLENLKRGTLVRDGDTKTRAQLFVCGAIIYLSEYDEIDKANTDKLMNSKLIKYFGLDAGDADAVISLLDEMSPKDADHIFLIEGASALRRWVANGDKTAGFRLGDLLQ